METLLSEYILVNLAWFNFRPSIINTLLVAILIYVHHVWEFCLYVLENVGSFFRV